MDETKILYCGSAKSGKTESIKSFINIVEKIAVMNYRRADIVQERFNIDGLLVSLYKIEASYCKPKPFLELFERPIWIYDLEGAIEQNDVAKRLLQDVGGAIFVSDASLDKRQENIIAMKALRVIFEEQGGARRLSDEPGDIACNNSSNLRLKPLVLQCNKMNLSNTISLPGIDHDLNWGNFASFESNALDGTGVIAALSAVVRQMFVTTENIAEARD